MKTTVYLFFLAICSIWALTESIDTYLSRMRVGAWQKEPAMGMKASEQLPMSFEELLGYLRSKTRVFMDVQGHEYYMSITSRTPTVTGAFRIARC